MLVEGMAPAGRGNVCTEQCKVGMKWGEGVEGVVMGLGNGGDGGGQIEPRKEQDQDLSLCILVQIYGGLYHILPTSFKWVPLWE